MWLVTLNKLGHISRALLILSFGTKDSTQNKYITHSFVLLCTLSLSLMHTSVSGGGLRTFLQSGYNVRHLSMHSYTSLFYKLFYSPTSSLHSNILHSFLFQFVRLPLVLHIFACYLCGQDNRDISCIICVKNITGISIVLFVWST